VLCSHLEPTTTYYILTRIQSMNDPSYDATGAAPSSGSGSASAGPNSAGSGAAGPGSAGDVNRPNSTVCHAVFLPKNQIAALREGREPVIQAADDLKNQLPQVLLDEIRKGRLTLAINILGLLFKDRRGRVCWPLYPFPVKDHPGGCDESARDVRRASQQQDKITRPLKAVFSRVQARQECFSCGGRKYSRRKKKIFFFFFDGFHL